MAGDISIYHLLNRDILVLQYALYAFNVYTYAHVKLNTCIELRVIDRVHIQIHFYLLLSLPNAVSAPPMLFGTVDRAVNEWPHPSCSGALQCGQPHFPEGQDLG